MTYKMPNNSFESTITEGLRRSLEAWINAELAKTKIDFIERFQQFRSELIASTVIELARVVSFTPMRDELVIRVLNKEQEK